MSLPHNEGILYDNYGWLWIMFEHFFFVEGMGQLLPSGTATKRDLLCLSITRYRCPQQNRVYEHCLIVIVYYLPSTEVLVGSSVLTQGFMNSFFFSIEADRTHTNLLKSFYQKKRNVNIEYYIRVQWKCTHSHFQFHSKYVFFFLQRLCLNFPIFSTFYNNHLFWDKVCLK